jgi:hypothetical protein
VSNAHLASVGFQSTGNVDVGTSSVGSSQLGGYQQFTLGTVGGPGSAALLFAEHAGAVLYVGPATGYVFATSQETGRVLLAVTTNGGSSWSTTEAPIPAT